MNLIKSQDYFNPIDVKERIHIIGCGSVGSVIAENLARLGLTNITLYDFDKVESHNIANQMFFDEDIGCLKTEATAKLIEKINPSAKLDIKIESDGYKNQSLNGYVFLAVDNIDTRREIIEAQKYNQSIKAIFDFRTGFEDAQHYAADWSNAKHRQALLKTMQFSHDEAKQSMPTTACGTTLGLAPVVRAVVTAGITNFVNFVKQSQLKKVILINPFAFEIDSI